MNAVHDEYHSVTSPDGVRLRVRVAGNLDGPPIVFIHGFCQSHLSWVKQFSGPLGRDFRLVAYDFRGHGWSDKPLEASAYREDRRWAADLAAVIGTLELHRPVLVGWSSGGRVILDYIAAFGDGGVAGINFVAATLRSDDLYYGEDIELVDGVIAEDPLTCVNGTRRFLRACFALQPEPDDFETMLAYNMMVPIAVRSMVRGRPFEAGSLLAALEIPVLLSHGTEDRLVLPAMSRYGADTIPGAQFSLYESIGHSPFFEAAERFDRELGEFARTCSLKVGT
jgi:pimeloyl-ACP methyl ester carboxylesterase